MRRAPFSEPWRKIVIVVGVVAGLLISIGVAQRVHLLERVQGWISSVVSECQIRLELKRRMAHEEKWEQRAQACADKIFLMKKKGEKIPETLWEVPNDCPNVEYAGIYVVALWWKLTRLQEYTFPDAVRDALREREDIQKALAIKDPKIRRRALRCFCISSDTQAEAEILKIEKKLAGSRALTARRVAESLEKAHLAAKGELTTEEFNAFYARMQELAGGSKAIPGEIWMEHYDKVKAVAELRGAKEAIAWILFAEETHHELTGEDLPDGIWLGILIAIPDKTYRLAINELKAERDSLNAKP